MFEKVSQIEAMDSGFRQNDTLEMIFKNRYNPCHKVL